MFDMGFLPDVRRIINCVPDERQTLLFSATMPDDVRMLARSVLRDPVTVQIGSLAPVASVSHAIYPVEQHLKTALLTKLLNGIDLKSVLVFTRTKDRATRVARQLKRSGFRTTYLQGDLSQSQRQQALDGFRNGKYKVLVATDIAARGIDVSSISHVINYDMPDTVEAYTHRIGRTGRAAMSGIAFSFVVREERAFVWGIEKAIREKVEIRTLSDFDYSVLPPAGTRAFSRKEIPSRPGNPRRAPAKRRNLTSCPFIMSK
jgi:ATP-dependent RNA helicase RhlE